ncbi:helix-turn-helix transcriptional regulator [Kitasatospora sp. MAP5-34]|uniref:helix-turn-helix domain-containing protein n=1 Tax=Kitasatospora sp. MAP5-34 TaxID=3035102 RepID=UPI0024761650|nr:helix-turn-helix transcriptional regulator [Kitasatospora sp. MAP5-34]MDH6575823.1 transcriptional regulator with XRE-family HTH domain [Kitasatospora sp. MAP5-34]
MTSEERRAFGARVAQLRKQRGMKQDELAVAINRTASWVSQVERGVQPVVRLDVLQLLADGLGVSVQVLHPDAPQPAPPAPPAAEEPNDLDGTRLLISGHPALDVLLIEQSASEAPSLAEFSIAVDEVWALTHAARFSELNTALGRLLPRLERAARTAALGSRPAVQVLLSQTYQALAAAFVRQDEADAAWVAADRAIRAAEQSARPLLVFAGIYRLAQAFLRLKHLDQADHVASSAVAVLKKYTSTGEPEPEAISVLGSLHLILAFVAARGGQRDRARDELSKARTVAAQLGTDRNDFNLEFGPTNVEIQAVSTAVDLGDAGEALDLGQRIDAGRLSPERRSRLLMDLGRAHAQRRHPGEALEFLLRAEELAPETVRTHVAARAVIRELALLAGRSASPELLGLAERVGALE